MNTYQLKYNAPPDKLYIKYIYCTDHHEARDIANELITASLPNDETILIYLAASYNTLFTEGERAYLEGTLEENSFVFKKVLYFTREEKIQRLLDNETQET